MKKTLLFFFACILAVYSFGQMTQKYPTGINDGNTPMVVPTPSMPGNTQNILNPGTDVMTTWVLPNTNSTSGNSRIPRNAGVRYEREEFLVLPSEMAAAGYPAGYTIDAIGFLIATAGVGTQSGQMTIYLMNTSDVTYTLGSTWTTTGFTTVSSDPAFTIPIAAGAYSIPFVNGSSFTYTGGGVYVAWEFSNPVGALGTTALVAYCNTNQATLCYGYQSAAAQGTALAVTAFRPATTFTNNTLVDIAAVTNIYATERTPAPFGTPSPVGVRVSNISASPLTCNVILTVKDVATSTVRYTATLPLTALAGGTNTVVNFPGWTPTLLEDVTINAVTSAIAGETYTANNSMTITANVNNNLFSYNYNLAGPGGYGFTTPGTGIFAAKYTMNGTGLVKGANLMLYNYAANTGNTIYAVLMNSAGTILSQSPNYTILATDLGTNLNFTFPTPQSVSNMDFYVGIAQTAGAAQWYPIGTYTENPARGNTFFTCAITGGTLTADVATLKYGIEAVLVAPATVVTTAATAITAATATLNGTVNANGNSSAVSFQYGLTAAYGSTVTAAPANATGLTVTNESAGITGLSFNTTYHYRIVATNIAGTTNGNDMTFTTGAGAPVVVTNLATNVAANTATLNGTVTANSTSTTVSFDYGLTVAYGTNVAGVPSSLSGNSALTTLANITGLVTNTTYHYRCVGVNSTGTVYGLDQTFLTGCSAPAGAAGAITGPATVCALATGKVYSVGTITNAISYAWTLPAGAVITAGAGTNSITVTFGSTAGNVTVAGVAAGTCGNGASSSIAVAVNALPVPTITGPSPACMSSANNVYTTQAGMTNYVWTVSAGGTITAGGTATSNTVTVTWTTSGAKTVTVNYTNGSGCSAAAATTFNVTVNPTPTPTIGSNNAPCVGSTGNMYYTEGGMTGYVWAVSTGGTIVSGQGTSAINVTWTGVGAQWVSVNYTGTTGCSAATPSIYNLFVNPMPNAAGAITGTATLCAGTNGVAYSCAEILNASSYTWTLPAGATIATGAGTRNITVNFGVSAVSGNITVSGTNSCGNGTASPAYAVTVNPLPAAAGTITGPASVCVGSTGVAYSVPAIANATTYVWTVPAGATITSGGTTRNIVVSYGTAAGTGTVTVKGTNTCGNGTAATLNVTMNAIPGAPVVTVSGNVLTSSAASGNQWYYSGNAIAGATGQTYTVTHNTGYYWCVVTTNGCSSPVSNKVWVVVTGVQELQNSNFSVYPVPNDGRFTVSITSPVQENYSIEVYNQLGAKIYELGDVTVNGTFEKQLDLRPVSNGIYSVVFLNSEHKVVKKVLVNK
ncbi:MAG: T9SS type A sorting domain-containing protein [Bacteroidota bacterium]